MNPYFLQESLGTLCLLDYKLNDPNKLTEYLETIKNKKFDQEDDSMIQECLSIVQKNARRIANKEKIKTVLLNEGLILNPMEINDDLYRSNRIKRSLRP